MIEGPWFAFVALACVYVVAVLYYIGDMIAEDGA